MAPRLLRSPSTISPELGRNANHHDGGYRATTAHALAYERASRPKPVFVLTHHARRPLEMRGGTTFRHRRLRRRL